MTSKRKANKMSLEEKQVYDSINIDRLIELVSACPYLFDGKDPKQANKSLKKKKWDEFDSMLDIPETMTGMAQKRFKNLKDFYSKKKRALQDAKASGSASIDMSKYQILDKMRFLEGTNVVRESSGNMTNDTSSGLFDSIINYEDSSRNENSVTFEAGSSVDTRNEVIPIDGIFTSGNITENSYYNEISILQGDDDDSILATQKKKKKNQSRTDSMFELAERIEKLKSDNLRKVIQTSADDDRNFLLSLLGNMKKLNEVDNSEFRLRVQMILHKLLVKSVQNLKEFEETNPQHQYCRKSSFQIEPSSSGDSVENIEKYFDNDSLDGDKTY